ncbi:MAG: LacI family DNA-binding transcriptional regulator [Sphingomonas bacterium]|nr:LacI family DNA-binding transcriptional regulator [Sphingomonas bacterium]
MQRGNSLKPVAVTIEHVAEAAGVSRQTVSRVINNHPNVKDLVRDRVRAAIDLLGYVPNLSARRMAGARSYLILAVNDRQRTLENWQAGRGNDWVDQMLFGGMTECERNGYHLVFELIDTDPKKAENDLAAIISALRPDGVILTPPHCDNAGLADLLKDRAIACARVGHRSGDNCVDVYMNEEDAAQRATEHLIGLGHRAIAFIAGSPRYGNSARRVVGFHRAIAAAGLPASAGQVGTGDFHFDSAAATIDRMMGTADRPTAIIADNDEMAFAALHVAAKRDLRVPDDLSIISFEDTPGVRFSVPPLTAIRQPTALMIAKACERLIAISAGGETGGSFELPYSLIERASTAHPAR